VKTNFYTQKKYLKNNSSIGFNYRKVFIQALDVCVKFSFA